MSHLEVLNVDEFADYLEEEGIGEEVVKSFKENKICGATFLELQNDELKELVPVVGSRVKVRKLLENATQASAEQMPVPSESPRATVLPPTPLREKASAEQKMLLPSESPRATVLPPTPLKEKDPNTAKTVSSVASKPDWHLSFHIPARNSFSCSVQTSIDTGVVSVRARREIVQTLRTLVLQHTRYPSSEQYNAICSSLIRQFPNLKDDIGSGYGSWKESLRTAFKNFRRDRPGDEENKKPPSASKQGCQQPPSKRLRHEPNEQQNDRGEITEEEYRQAVANLKSEWKKGKHKRDHAVVKQLMETTFTRRRQWITGEQGPLVCEVVEEFPCLQSTKVAHREFRQITRLDGRVTALMDSWQQLETKLVEYAKVEASTRPVIAKCLTALEEDDLNEIAYPADHRCALVVDLLIKLLYPRGVSKGNVLVKSFEDCDVNLDSEVWKIEQKAPYVVITGRPGMENSQYFIACEKVIHCDCKSLKDALLDLVVTYYVYDISYPKPFNAFLIFFQHFIFGMKDQQNVPLSASKLWQNLSKL